MMTLTKPPVYPLSRAKTQEVTVDNREVTPAHISYPTFRRLVYDVRAGEVEESIQPNFPCPLTQVKSKLERLRDWPEGWNGSDVAAPKSQAIVHALRWIEVFYQEVQLFARQWQEPHVTANEDGDVLLEWWHKEKGLAIYISETEATYLCDWSASIVDMDEGAASSAEVRRRLWHWLMA